MFELLFLLGFTLHNIEEALWMPQYSQHAGRYQRPVAKNEFHFAVLVVTILGYILTFLFLASGKNHEIIRYLYLGFVMMMCFNAIFPHLLSTIVLKKYSPGTLTGLLLNLPVGLYVIFAVNGNGLEVLKLAVAFVVTATLTVLSLRPLFRLGRRITGYK